MGHPVARSFQEVLVDPPDLADRWRRSRPPDPEVLSHLLDLRVPVVPSRQSPLPDPPALARPLRQALRPHRQDLVVRYHPAVPVGRSHLSLQSRQWHPPVRNRPAVLAVRSPRLRRLLQSRRWRPRALCRPVVRSLRLLRWHQLVRRDRPDPVDLQVQRLPDRTVLRVPVVQRALAVREVRW